MSWRSVRAGRAIAVVLALVVHGPTHAQEELPRWDVDPRPALEIGVADALDAEMFVRATDAVLLESGGVAVLDAGGGRVRVFDDSGHPIGGFGQTGEGPGEWIAPLAIETIGDTLVVWDSRRGILSRWSQDGIFLEERRVPHHRTFHEGSLLPDGSLIIPRYAEDGDRPPAGSRYRAYADLLLYAKGEIRDLGPFPFEEMVVGSPVQPAYRSRSIAVGGGQPLRLYVGDDTNEPRVRRYDVEGRLLDTLALLDVRRAPGDEDRRRIEAEIEALVGREALTRRALAAIGEPERTPAFEDLFADDDGRLWTLAHDAAGDWRAIVYASGRPVARLALPPHREVLDIRDGLIAVRAAGALEEDIVRVYAFHEP